MDLYDPGIFGKKIKRIRIFPAMLGTRPGLGQNESKYYHSLTQLFNVCEGASPVALLTLLRVPISHGSALDIVVRASVSAGDSMASHGCRTEVSPGVNVSPPWRHTEASHITSRR